MTDPFARFGLLMVRMRWAVLVFWLVLIGVAGGVLAPKAPKVLKAGGNVDPGSESVATTTILERDFNQSTANNVVALFRSPTATVDDPDFRREVEAASARMAAVEHVSAVDNFYRSGIPQLVSPDRHTTIAVVSIRGDESDVQVRAGDVLKALNDGTKIEHYLTGLGAINNDLQLTSEEDLKRSELFTIPIVLLLLLFVFRTVIASAIPLVLGAGSVVTAQAVIYLVGRQTDTSIFATNVTSMIGLGLGIDFSLIIVNRFREEMALGRSRSEAIAVTMATAGRSITYSGVTVLLGMLLMTLLLNLFLVRSISLAVMLVATTALLAGLTLLPALLAILGHRIEWLRVIPKGKPRAAGEQGFWYRLSHAIMRRPWLWLAVSLGVLLIIAFPAREIRVQGSDPGLLPKEAQSVRGVRALEQSVGSSRLNPIQIVMRTDQPNGVWTPAFLQALQSLSDTAAADPRAEEVFSLSTAARDAGIPPDQFKNLTPELLRADPARAAQATRFVNLNGDNTTAALSIFVKSGRYDKQHQQFVRDLREKIIPGDPQLSAYSVIVGGNAAEFMDFSDALYSRFPVLVLAVMAMTFIILMMFFQSLLLPLKAILMNLATIVATYGVLVLIFQHGWGDNLLGFDHLGSLTVITPPILFVILFSLSTDYEVFMLSRVKEFYHELHDNEEAVAAGLENTARVITAAGLILVGTFASFAVSRVVIVKEIGIGLAVGVLLDSTIVRVVMVPATMRLMGAANWWMPAWLKRFVPELREGPAPALTPANAVALAGAGVDAAAGRQRHGRTGIFSTLSLRRGTQGLHTVDIGQLRPTGGSVGVDVITLPQMRPFRIGRDEENELQLYDARISREHARIDHVDGRFVVTDLGSTNGVFVNGKQIHAPTTLRHGDLIEVGNMGTVTFAFEQRTEMRPSTIAMA